MYAALNGQMVRMVKVVDCLPFSCGSSVLSMCEFTAWMRKGTEYPSGEVAHMSFTRQVWRREFLCESHRKDWM